MSKLLINFRSISHSPAIKFYIDRYFKKMNRIYQNIRTCNITIDVTKNHHQKIKLYTVCIDVTMPKKPLVIRKQHNNLYIAIRDGFYAAEKLLDKYSKRKQTAYKSGWSIKNQNYSPTQLL